MKMDGVEITGVKVINIIEENAAAIENMVNRAIKEIREKDLVLMDVQTTADNIFLILGKRHT
ncbi:MAG: hypothetical protein KC553_01145 [Nitrospina sp.]|nr:hypothetical protein [Nitrospina sp.]